MKLDKIETPKPPEPTSVVRARVFFFGSGLILGGSTWTQADGNYDIEKGIISLDPIGKHKNLRVSEHSAGVSCIELLK